MIHINIIGAGRVGQTWAELIRPLPHYSVQAICASRKEKSKIAELPAADLFFITVPDDQIAETARIVLESHHDTTLIHCSGSLPASILNPENRADIQAANIHPLISIVNPKKTAANFAGTICTVEGDTNALKLVTELFHALGAELHAIPTHQKSTYHAACCLAANYLVTLADSAYQQFEKADIDPITSKKITEQLMQSVLDNLKADNTYSNCLTGPIARNDQRTIEHHLAVLKPELKALYSALGEKTLEIAHLSVEDKAFIMSILRK